MPIDPKKLSLILAQAKQAAAKKVEDPGAEQENENTGGPLEKDPLQPAEVSFKSEQQLLPTPAGIPVATPPEPQVANVVDFSYPGLYELSERILRLDAAIASNHPEFDSILQTIHRNLDKDEQLLHLLKPDQISSIFRGLKKKTQTVLVEDTVKSSGSGRNKGLAKLGLDDL
jgi:hypothetical protein